MINERIQARAAKADADARERYQRLYAHLHASAHDTKAERHTGWEAAVRNQMGISNSEPIPMPKLCDEFRSRRSVTLHIDRIDLPARARLFAAIASILTK
jgi:hypothetical protein